MYGFGVDVLWPALLELFEVDTGVSDVVNERYMNGTMIYSLHIEQNQRV